jgi:hypothetical protein
MKGTRRSTPWNSWISQTGPADFASDPSVWCWASLPGGNGRIRPSWGLSSVRFLNDSKLTQRKLMTRAQGIAHRIAAIDGPVMAHLIARQLLSVRRKQSQTARRTVPRTVTPGMGWGVGSPTGCRTLSLPCAGDHTSCRTRAGEVQELNDWRRRMTRKLDSLPRW